jgi:hypothetical protein
MTNLKNVTRLISKHMTKKVVTKLQDNPQLLNKRTSIKKNKPVDWTTPKDERHNQIKRSWITDKK